MPTSERIGLYPGREKVAHGDPSLDSFAGAVGRYCSLGRQLRDAEADIDSLTADQILHFRKQFQEYRKMSRRLADVSNFVCWCKDGESFKDFKIRWAHEHMGTPDTLQAQLSVLREVQADERVVA